MRRLAAVVTLGLALVLATAASATNPGRETINYNAADMAAARAATVKRADLQPANGWKGGAIKYDYSTPRCANYHPKLSQFVSTGAAGSDWYHGVDEVVSQTDVLQSAQMVRREWQLQVENPAALSCSGKEAIKRFTSQGATVISLKRISSPQIAPYVAAWRLVGKAGGQAFAIELLSFGRSRTENSLQISGASSAKAAISSEALRLAHILLGRLKA